MTFRSFVALVALTALAAWPLAARAEHASIDLRVMRLDPATGAEKGQETAHADQEPPHGGVNPRRLFKVKVGEPLVLQFILTNTYPHGDNKDVVVRWFVVRQEKARQKDVPPLGDGVVTQGRFKMNFKPKCKVGARVNFTLTQPGVYLLRIDTDNTNSDHEHFSAIDVQAE